MGKDFESAVCQWQPDGQFPNAKSSKLPFDSGMQNKSISCAVPSNCPLGFSGLPYFKQDLLKKPQGLSSCLPNSIFYENFLTKSKLPTKVESCEGVDSLMTKNFCGPKQFLVFDQNGNKMRMMFSSGVGNPILPVNSSIPKATSGYEIGLGSSSGNYYSGPNMTDELDEGSEMHEDTEEINALLYSDGYDSYSKDGDGEETSTGHSPPSTMSAYDDEMEDEVASSYGPNKRKKSCDRSSYGEAPSVKPNRCIEFEDDAHSSCADSKSPVRNGSNKRSRRDKIRETVKILQTIIPGGKGKDAVMVLDETIDYLRTLRFKAKSLGL